MDSSRSGKNLVVYRSTRPFTGTDSLVSAILVATIPDDGTPFVDYPVPGVPCYYAVIDEPSLRSGSPFLFRVKILTGFRLKFQHNSPVFSAVLCLRSGPCLFPG